MNIALDEVVALETWAGRCEATVARLTDCEDHRRIGLKRISDITVISKKAIGSPDWLLKKLPIGKTIGRRKQAAAGLMIAMVTLTAGGWMLWASPRPEGPSGMATAEANSAETSASTTDSSETQNDANATATPAEPPAANASPEAVLDRLATLRMPKVAAALALSEQQKLDISRLLKKTSNELARSRARLREKSRDYREARLSAIVVNAENRIRSILTTDQQARWQQSE